MSIELWFDTETTGVMVNWDELMTLSGFIIKDGVRVETFDLKAKPSDPDKWSEGACAVNGITKEMMLSFPEGKDVFTQFTELLERHNPSTKSKYCKKDVKYWVGGYNTQFDIAMLSNFFSAFAPSTVSLSKYLNFYQKDAMHKVYDAIADGRISALGDHKLGTMCARYNIELDAHNSMSDIEATWKLWKELV